MWCQLGTKANGGVTFGFSLHVCTMGLGGFQFSFGPQPLWRGQWVGVVEWRGLKLFPCFGGIFKFPRFILSILNVHKWGNIFFYPSSKMRNSGAFRQTGTSKGTPASNSVRHKATSTTAIPSFACVQSSPPTSFHLHTHMHIYIHSCYPLPSPLRSSCSRLR